MSTYFAWLAQESDIVADIRKTMEMLMREPLKPLPEKCCEKARVGQGQRHVYVEGYGTPMYLCDEHWDEIRRTCEVVEDSPTLGLLFGRV